jgi:glycosyltransferase involved in cell wall biosynthesis
LLRDRPDCIFVQDYATGRFDVLLVLARLLGIPLIAYHTGSWPEGYVGRPAKRWTIPRADRLIVSSRGEGEMLARRYGVRPERLALVLTPIDTAAFRPLERAAACRAAGLDPGRRHLLFVGRLDDDVKRVSALVRAFAGLAAEHPDADLVIGGDGPDGEDLRRLAAELAPGRVRFLGWVTGPEALAPLYNAAECLVLPSRSEGFPTVVGEAMACGTPVLASRVGGVPELVVEGETGWLIPPGDDAALAAALSRVLARPKEAAALRPRVRAMAEERVSPAAVAAALRECFPAGGRRHG